MAWEDAHNTKTASIDSVKFNLHCVDAYPAVPDQETNAPTSIEKRKSQTKIKA